MNTDSTIIDAVKSVKKTPLYEKHIQAKAKMVEFAGFMMPIEYEGIIAEHQAVRHSAGLFDLTHMGEIEVRGEGAEKFLQKLITNDLLKTVVGGAIYSPVCNQAGGILDDVIVYRMEDRFMVVANASNKDKIYRWLLEHEEKDCKVVDNSDNITLIAIQGPKAEEILQNITNVELSKIEFYHFVTDAKILDTKGIISRTGYTGEDGFELYIKNEDAESIWDSLMVEGQQYNIKPIGLGARDTLRLEAKYPLYGNELGEDINPLEAGLKWAVKLEKEDFIGKSALVKIQEEKPSRTLAGFELTKSGVPRHGYKVFSVENKESGTGSEEIGYVTSGTFSPTLKKSIGLCLIKKGFGKVGSSIYIEIRKKKVPATIIKTPFHLGTVKNKKK